MTVDLAWLIVLAVLLIVLAGLAVCAETAVARVAKSSVEEAVRDGGPRTHALAGLIEHRAKYVNALLLWSTIATVTATTLVGYIVLQLAPELPDGWDVVIAAAIMVIISFVLLGVTPRTLGNQHALAVARASARITRFLALISEPVIVILIGVGNAVTPGKGYRNGPFATQAELRELVDLAEADSLIEDDERQMIHSVFELGETFAREVMVPRTQMVYIERSKSLRQALSLGLRSGYSRIPVIGESADDIVGIVYLKDVVARTFDHRESEQSERVESLMRAAHFVPDSKQVDDLLREMQANRVHMAVVLDEYGGTAGIVTIEDILEEIVGEIVDEYDTELPEVAELPDGSWRVSSRLHVEDFAEMVGVDIDSEEEGVDTILGYMALRLGKVPIAGTSIDVADWRLTAEQPAGRRKRVMSVLVERIAPSAIDGSDVE